MSDSDPRAEDRAGEENAGTGGTAWENTERGMEAPEADAVEQQAAAGAQYAEHGHPGDVRYDVNEADAAEQSIDVDLDDDDYR